MCEPDGVKISRAEAFFCVCFSIGGTQYSISVFSFFVLHKSQVGTFQLHRVIT